MQNWQTVGKGKGVGEGTGERKGEGDGSRMRLPYRTRYLCLSAIISIIIFRHILYAQKDIQIYEQCACILVQRRINIIPQAIEIRQKRRFFFVCSAFIPIPFSSNFHFPSYCHSTNITPRRVVSGHTVCIAYGSSTFYCHLIQIVEGARETEAKRQRDEERENEKME